MKRIVYFVGAGLTKSIEVPEKPVPLMYDFVKVMAEYVYDDVILTTLVQLEVSGLFDRPCPEAARLAKLLLTDANRSVQNRAAFRTALNNRPPESIEALLEKTAASGLLQQRFKYAINRLFLLVDWTINWQPLDRFLSRQMEGDESWHTFVSFNYDLLLERALQHLTTAAWTPHSGYGVPIYFYVVDDPPVLRGAGAFAPTEIRRFQEFDAGSGAVQVLKPHGSLNWLVPEEIPVRYERTGVASEAGPIVVPLTESHEIRYWGSSEAFQWLRLPEEGTPRSWWLYIVPPTEAAKRGGPSFLAEIRAKEIVAIKDADEVYVLGWSIPETDRNQAELIRSSVAGRRKPIDRVTVVNRGAQPKYYEQVAMLFGVAKSAVRVFNEGFVDFVARHCE